MKYFTKWAVKTAFFIAIFIVLAPGSADAEIEFGVDWKIATPRDVAGIDRHARDRFGFTPLHYAAAETYNPAVITALVKAGIEVNARGVLLGFTPLHIAATVSTNPAVITALLEAGAEVNARDKVGYTPMYYARRNGNPAIATALVDAGGTE